MLADHLLGVPELQREPLVVQLLEDSRANRVPLRGRKLLEQRQRLLITPSLGWSGGGAATAMS